MDGLVRVQLSLGSEGTDPERLDELTLALRRELRDDLALDVITHRPHTAPPNAKGDGFSVGVLALAVLPALLPKFFEFLQQWVTRQRGCSVRVKLDTEGRVIELDVTNSRDSIESILRTARDRSPASTT
ncbi:MAG TPA: hypothetical protein VIV60_33870 [Polyangiaceae bacterium]